MTNNPTFVASSDRIKVHGPVGYPQPKPRAQTVDRDYEENANNPHLLVFDRGVAEVLEDLWTYMAAREL